MELDLAALNLARDIPDEVVLQIAFNLSAKDILNLATTCKKLTSTLNADNAWESKVFDWIAEQDPRSGIVGTSAKKMKELLGLKTLRSTYEALILLKVWPCGLWYSKDFQPEGMLLWASYHGETTDTARAVFMLEDGNPSSFSSSLGFPWPELILKWEFVLDEQRHPHSGIYSFKIQSKKGVVCSEVVSMHADRLRQDFKVNFDLHRKDQFAMYLKEDILNRKPDVVWNWYRAGVVDEATKEEMIEGQPHLPPPGLYSAIYGSHGMEIVQLEQAEGTKYTAVKLRGDKNVPATKISFRFDTSTGTRPGPYDGNRDDPFPLETGPRPIFSFASTLLEHMPYDVDMEKRPVSTVISNAQGQINRDPREWQPEIVPATVVVYDYSLDSNVATSSPIVSSIGRCLQACERAVFSVIFEDPDEEFRHVMDFHRVHLPQHF
jgi:Cyclin D1 binding domain